jgi:uncharacterized protein with FMN-binding domain
MRRAPLVLGATVVGTAGVLLYQPMAASSLSSTSSTGSSTATSSGSTSSSSGSTDSSSSTSSSTPSASSSSSSGDSSGSSSSSTTITASETGTAATSRFGTTQVKVTIKDGKITAVDVVAYNNGDPRSAQISEAAIPTLTEEVLSKQTAAVDVVSGATYTSLQYEASLQAALDKAGFTAPDKSKASTNPTYPAEGGH